MKKTTTYSREQFLDHPGNFRIARRVGRESRRGFAFSRILPNVFRGYSSQPISIGDLALTLLGEGEVRRARQSQRMIGARAIDSFSRRELSDSALKQSPHSQKVIRPWVIDVAFFGEGSHRKSLVAILDDNRGELEEERQRMLDYLGIEPSGYNTIPHVTIAHTDTMATSDMLEWTMERVPDRLSLAPPKPF